MNFKSLDVSGSLDLPKRKERKFAMQRFAMLLWVAAALSIVAHAQTFSSGSTGADGALDLTSGDRVVQLPESGILNYTTINIPANKVLRFKPNLRNTPVTLLAQGDVNIAGQISVSAGENAQVGVVTGAGTGSDARFPGPGGFFGGAISQPGFGPGGGLPISGFSDSKNAKWVGPLSLVPIIGGSGGAGPTCGGFSGGGGGGAIVLASSKSIVISGSIYATGSSPSTVYECLVVDTGGGGSGGAVRLVANSVTVSGNLNASGFPGLANAGTIRVEAPLEALNFTGGSIPAAVRSTINPAIVSSAPPNLTIVSVGGFPVPSYSGTRFDTVDLLLPNQLPDPISVVVQASNIPVSTPVKITFGTSTGASSTTGTLAGTLASSTATLSVSGLSRTAVTYLFVSTTFSVPSSAAIFNQEGPDRVADIRMNAELGAKPTLAFLRSDGTQIELGNVPETLRRYFGQ
jgi:hypothetical protein